MDSLNSNLRLTLSMAVTSSSAYVSLRIFAQPRSRIGDFHLTRSRSCQIEMSLTCFAVLSLSPYEFRSRRTRWRETGCQRLL